MLQMLILFKNIPKLPTPTPYINLANKPKNRNVFLSFTYNEIEKIKKLVPKANPPYLIVFFLPIF